MSVIIACLLRLKYAKHGIIKLHTGTIKRVLSNYFIFVISISYLVSFTLNSWYTASALSRGIRQRTTMSNIEIPSPVIELVF